MKIVQFPGTEKIEPGEQIPIPQIVEALEDYLKDAKEGTLRAIAVAAVYEDETVSSIAPLKVNYGLTHALSMLSYRWCEMNDRAGKPD